METDIEITIHNRCRSKVFLGKLDGGAIGYIYTFHYKDETIHNFKRFSKGLMDGPQYRFNDKLKEIEHISKFKHGKTDGKYIGKVYKKDGWGSDMLEVIIRKNDKVVKRMKPRVVLD
jgi:hypothetical protein